MYLARFFVAIGLVLVLVYFLVQLVRGYINKEHQKDIEALQSELNLVRANLRMATAKKGLIDEIVKTEEVLDDVKSHTKQRKKG
ncbi:MAG TPA: hypothetical protein PKN48_01075 [Bacteroidales bacterium]|nr:hypothetical protein [Bacteroidales bacterium]